MATNQSHAVLTKVSSLVQSQSSIKQNAHISNLMHSKYEAPAQVYDSVIFEGPEPFHTEKKRAISVHRINRDGSRTRFSHKQRSLSTYRDQDLRNLPKHIRYRRALMRDFLERSQNSDSARSLSSSRVTLRIHSRNSSRDSSQRSLKHKIVQAYGEA